MATLTYLTTTHFDFGAVQQLPSELRKAGITKPFIATDAGVRAVGLVEKVTRALDADVPLSLFDETPGNPTEAAVAKAFAQYTADGCDGIIAIGGGSSMDLGKAVALLAGSGGPLAQFDPLAGGAKLIKSVAPLIAVPTTAGTGSEVSVGFVIIMNDGRKLTYASPLLIPKAALCDPELTLGLPKALTAATGMDAITHCIEAFLAPTVNPPADAVAAMNADIGLPSGLSAMGVQEDDIPDLIAYAQKDLAVMTNPRKVSADDFEGMIRESL